jgi:hypothetical protein
VKRINDIVESEANSKLAQSLHVNLAAGEGAAAVKEAA